MSTALQTEVAKNNITGFELLEIELDDATHRFTNGPFDSTHEGNTYQALGNFLGFSDVSENTQMQIAEVTVTLTGLLQSDFGFFVNTNFIDRPVRIFRQLFNDQVGIVGTFKIFEGRFNSAACEDDGEILTVGGTASNSFVDFERRSGRRTNNDVQEFYYPGDKFFEFAKEVLKEISWKP
tara:strand:+ start:1493 stop:2032 length:540 start_codon:yes stop_codon:yes gene_type:complete